MYHKGSVGVSQGGDLTAEAGGHGQEARCCAASSGDRGGGLEEPGMQEAQLCEMAKVREGPSLEPWQGVGLPVPTL